MLRAQSLVHKVQPALGVVRDLLNARCSCGVTAASPRMNPGHRTASRAVPTAKQPLLTRGRRGRGGRSATTVSARPRPSRWEARPRLELWPFLASMSPMRKVRRQRHGPPFCSPRGSHPGGPSVQSLKGCVRLGSASAPVPRCPGAPGIRSMRRALPLLQ